jgi:hypothetical protein
MFNCKFCGKCWSSKRSKSFHENRCHENPNRIIGENQYTKAKKLGIDPPILSEDSRDRIRKAAIIQSKTRWTPEARKRHSDIMKRAVLNNPDSYSKNNVCGRVKIIDYRGYKLKGGWELIVAKWLDLNNIKWKTEVNPQKILLGK